MYRSFINPWGWIKHLGRVRGWEKEELFQPEPWGTPEFRAQGDKKEPFKEICSNSQKPEENRTSVEGVVSRERYAGPKAAKCQLGKWPSDSETQTRWSLPMSKEEHRFRWGHMTQISGSLVGSTQAMRPEIAVASTTDGWFDLAKALGDVSAWERLS